MIDLYQAIFCVGFCDRDSLVLMKGRQASSLRLFQEFFHGEVERGGVVVEEIFEKPGRERGVGECRVLDGKECGVGRGKYDFRGDLKKSCHDIEAGSS